MTESQNSATRAQAEYSRSLLAWARTDREAYWPANGWLSLLPDTLEVHHHLPVLPYEAGGSSGLNLEGRADLLLARLALERAYAGDWSLMDIFRGASTKELARRSARCGSTTRGISHGGCRAKSVPGRNRCRHHGGWVPPRLDGREQVLLICGSVVPFKRELLSYFQRRTELLEWQEAPWIIDKRRYRERSA